MKKIAAIAAVLVLAACGTPDTEVEPTESAPTVTVTHEVTKPTVEETTEEPMTDEEIDAFMKSEEIQILILQQAWDEQPWTNKEDICIGWNIEEFQEHLLTTFLSGGTGVEADVARDFFDEVCS